MMKLQFCASPCINRLYFIIILNNYLQSVLKPMIQLLLTQLFLYSSSWHDICTLSDSDNHSWNNYASSTRSL